MHLFIYEAVTGGGFLDESDVPPSLFREAATIVGAVVEDACRLDGVQVRVMQDERFSPALPKGCAFETVSDPEQEGAAFARFVESADLTLLIAPEMNFMLADRAEEVAELGGRLLSPSHAVVALAGDKPRLNESLGAAGVPVPRGRLLCGEPHWPRDFPYPAVAKPRDGAGSWCVSIVRDCDEGQPSAGELWLEEYQPGLPVSVTFLCGPQGAIALPPGYQRLREDGSFRYLGGRLPLEPALAERAVRLAREAVAVLPDAVGYLGVDLVLGAATDGQQDVVIEINPRLTMSYLGLRQLLRENLVEAMLAVRAGRPCELSCHDHRIEFGIDGTFRLEPTADPTLG